MNLDWTTFALEIVNFLVLVWLLKRFLYRPVTAIIARRREGIEKTLADAQAANSAAVALKERYTTREAEWAKEREAARAELDHQLAGERDRALAALGTQLAKEREKARAREESRLAEWRRAAEGRALSLGAAFSAKLLARLADPALESRLVDIAVEELPKLPTAEVQPLAEQASADAPEPEVTSAYPLDERRRAAIGESLSALLGRRVHAVFKEDPELLAGLSVRLGAWVVHANLRDELKFFATTA